MAQTRWMGPDAATYIHAPPWRPETNPPLCREDMLTPDIARVAGHYRGLLAAAVALGIGQLIAGFGRRTALTGRGRRRSSSASPPRP